MGSLRGGRRGAGWLRIISLLAVAIAPPAANAHSIKKKGLEIDHPWTREEKDLTTASVHMTIKNRSGRPDRLLAASTPSADKVELLDAGDVVLDQRSAAARSFVIKPGSDLELHPKGLRLVLRGVKQRFHPYDYFTMTLVFEKAGRVDIDVMIEEAETEAPPKH